jgi:hypothetical protein
MWKDLIKHAVLGIDKKPIPLDLIMEWEQLGLPNSAHNPQQYMLNALILGDKLHRLTAPFYEDSIATDFVKTDFRKALLPILSNIFSEMIAFDDSLFEKKMLQIIIASDFDIPAEHLPYFIEKGKVDPYLNDFLILNGGVICNYLIQENKDWASYYAAVDFAAMSSPLQLGYLSHQIKKNRVAAFQLFYAEAPQKKKPWIESALQLFDFDTEKNKPYKQLYFEEYKSKSYKSFIEDSRLLQQSLETKCFELLKTSIAFDKKIIITGDRKVLLQNEKLCKQLSILLTHSVEEIIAILYRHVDSQLFLQYFGIEPKEWIAAIFDNENLVFLQNAFIDTLIATKNIPFFLWSLKYLKPASIQLFLTKTAYKWNDTECNLIISKLTNEDIMQLENIWLTCDNAWNHENVLRFLGLFQDLNDKIDHLKLFNKIMLSTSIENYLKTYYQAREIFTLKNRYLQDFKVQQKKLDLLNQFYKNTPK